MYHREPLVVVMINYDGDYEATMKRLDEFCKKEKEKEIEDGT